MSDSFTCPIMSNNSGNTSVFWEETEPPPHYHPNHSMVAILIHDLLWPWSFVHIIKHNELFVLFQCCLCKFSCIPSISFCDTSIYQADKPFFLKLSNHVPLWHWKLDHLISSLLNKNPIFICDTTHRSPNSLYKADLYHIYLCFTSHCDLEN